ncbi:hypothetical protein DK847_00745 [Aestuariivirga litoralis]|uniref:Uncharacterized protein n=1 Tax=Aestuariivirga litoralis TaxID=2650924 RepID=A0A2W2BDR8_9HYPH|nr:hypothetical protein [Aestuariivirga litoralis]PZF78384.1 hypothetical protein DK847_00745 [Aestuariivirga litoralis]
MEDKQNHFDIWFWLGLLAGVSLAAILFTSPLEATFHKWLQQYQTLVSAVLALSAAWFTVKAARLQIEHAMHLEDAKNNQRLLAARTLIPFALSDIEVFCTTSLERLYEIEAWRDTGPAFATPIGQTRFVMAQLPESAFQKLRDVVEVAPLDVSIELGRLLSSIQISTSRLADLEKWVINAALTESEESILYERMVDLFRISARAHRFYGYGRLITNKVRTGELQRDEILDALAVLRRTSSPRMLTKKIESFPTET